MNMLLLLALAAVRVHAKLVEKTLTARDQKILVKALFIDRWFEDRRQHPRREIVGRVRSAAKRAADESAKWRFHQNRYAFLHQEYRWHCAPARLVAHRQASSGTVGNRVLLLNQPTSI